MILLEDLPDLVIDNALSFLEWPHEVLLVVLINKRFSAAIQSHVGFKSILLESHESIHLPDAAHFSRTRAKLPPTTKSTIALAFSSDGHTLASTHGDHTVKLIDISASVKSTEQPADGCVLAELSGHPRTPWTVKFHPTDPHLVASGCLGGNLRLWDTRDMVACKVATLPHPVISLSFHPDGKKLAAAAGTMLYLWDFEQDAVPKVILQTKVSLRCVRFLDSGRILVGVRSQSNSTGITNYIRAARAQLLLYEYKDGVTLAGKPIVVVRRALLYNDAGLDVANNTVLTCAEFWQVPPGSAGAAARTPLSPLAAHDFVGGGDLDAAEQLANEEDVQHEKQGHERVAHLVQVSLGRTTDAKDKVSAGQLIRSASLEGLWAGAQATSDDSPGGTFVTSVKLSPTSEYILLGCSRGNTAADRDSSSWQHPVAAIWRLGDMKRMSTLLSRTDQNEEDDANVALFHPKAGAGVVYGTKQGHIACALSPEVMSQQTPETYD